MREEAAQEKAKEVRGVELLREVGQQESEGAEGQQRLQGVVLEGLDRLGLGQVYQGSEGVDLSACTVS